MKIKKCPDKMSQFQSDIKVISFGQDVRIWPSFDLLTQVSDDSLQYFEPNNSKRKIVALLVPSFSYVCDIYNVLNYSNHVAKKSLQELKQLFFQLKDDVFGTAKVSNFGCDGSKFSKILQSYFGEKKMTDVSEPRYINENSNTYKLIIVRLLVCN